jgi:hypothetical protein
MSWSSPALVPGRSERQSAAQAVNNDGSVRTIATILF